jgi:hypothetical protein
MAKIIIVTECTDSLALLFYIVKESNGKRHLVKRLSEVTLTAKYPMLEDNQILYEFVESYATTLARELGCAEVEWDYSQML